MWRVRVRHVRGGQVREGGAVVGRRTREERRVVHARGERRRGRAPVDGVERRGGGEEVH